MRNNTLNKYKRDKVLKRETMIIQPMSINLNTINFSSMLVNKEQTMTNPLFNFGFESNGINTKESDKQQAKAQLMEIVKLAEEIKEDESEKEAKQAIQNKMNYLRAYAKTVGINLNEVLTGVLGNASEEEQKQITQTIGMNFSNKNESQVEKQIQATPQNFFETMSDILKSNKTAKLIATAVEGVKFFSSQSNATISPANIKNFGSMLDVVLKYEGGYVNDPTDRGGETNKGITHRTYDAYRKSKGLPTQSVRNITNEEVQEIYYKNYYQASGAEQYTETNPQFALAIFDASVNHGVGKAKQWLKESNGDLNVFMQKRADFYHRIVANNPSQRKFLKGWQNRWNDLNAKTGSEAKWA